MKASILTALIVSALALVGGQGVIIHRDDGPVGGAIIVHRGHWFFGPGAIIERGLGLVGQGIITPR